MFIIIGKICIFQLDLCIQLLCIYIYVETSQSNKNHIDLIRSRKRKYVIQFDDNDIYC